MICSLSQFCKVECGTVYVWPWHWGARVCACVPAWVCVGVYCGSPTVDLLSGAEELGVDSPSLDRS